MGKKVAFDSYAGRNPGGIIASGSALYIVRTAHGHEGDVHYASPLLNPDRVLHMGERMVTPIPRKHLRTAIEKVLRDKGCFFL